MATAKGQGCRIPFNIHKGIFYGHVQSRKHSSARSGSVQLAPVKSRTAGLGFNVHSGRFQVHETIITRENEGLHSYLKVLLQSGTGKEGSLDNKRGL